MHALPDREVQSKISRRNGAQMLSPQHGISAYWGTLGRAFRNPVLGRAADSFDRTAWLAGSLSPLSARLDGKNSLCAVETRRKCPLTAGFSNAFFESLVLRKGTRPISDLSLCGKKSRSWRRKGVVARASPRSCRLEAHSV